MEHIFGLLGSGRMGYTQFVTEEILYLPGYIQFFLLFHYNSEQIGPGYPHCFFSQKIPKSKTIILLLNIRSVDTILYLTDCFGCPLLDVVPVKLLWK